MSELMPGATAGNAITLIDFADSFAAKVNSVDAPYIHPSAAAGVWKWLCDMRAEAEAGHADEVARLARIINEKITDEVEWHEQKLRGLPHA
jgi:hypothetical protein